jgi:plasmid stabilization system protein ParE
MFLPPRDGMANFRLSDRARADLIDIYDFTEGAFGPYQAEAYHAGLERSAMRSTRGVPSPRLRGEG